MSQAFSRFSAVFGMGLVLVLVSPAIAEEGKELSGWAYENDPEFDSETDTTATSAAAAERASGNDANSENGASEKSTPKAEGESCH